MLHIYEAYEEVLGPILHITEIFDQNQSQNICSGLKNCLANSNVWTISGYPQEL